MEFISAIIPIIWFEGEGMKMWMVGGFDAELSLDL
jgi:hypothetical protein